MGFHEVCFNDLGFDRARMLRPSGIGEPTHRWLYYGMPKLQPHIAQCVFFLFRRNPKTGEIDGPHGSGFFISRSARKNVGLEQIYAVTNWHVAVQLGASIIRMNTAQGTRYLEYDPADWVFDRDNDLAILDVHEDTRPTDQFSYINERDFLAGSAWDSADITIGEDVFMVGLFAEHHGGDRNVPSARFGNVSMLASARAPVRIEHGAEVPCHLVDTHSRGGFSGSPVFAFRTNNSDLSKPYPAYVGVGTVTFPKLLFGLLGVHCGQFWEHIEARKSPKTAERLGDAIVDGDRLWIPSSMTIVTPAWNISKLLDAEPLRMTREKREGLWEAEQASKTPRFERVALPDPPATDENPQHREDFTSLLGKAARTPPQDD